eukprot:PhF_6_TR34221/c0_g1_i1/m.50203/K09313/CUTL; homeobox protein cut-like
MNSSRWDILKQRFLDVSNVSNKWRSVDWSALQSQISAEVARATANRQVLGETRRHVATRTKEFGAMDDNARRTELPTLLRMYQNYIDDLTKSIKALEGSYQHLRDVLHELPDPTLPMEALAREVVVVDTAKELEGKFFVVNDRVVELEKEISSLKNQERTIMDLKETVERQKDVQNVVEDAQDEIRTLRLRDQILTRDHNDMVARLREQQKALETAYAQVEEWKSRAEGDQVGSDMHTAILANELEGAMATVQALERENARLRGELNSTGGPDAFKKHSVHTTEDDALVFALNRDLQQANDALLIATTQKQSLEKTNHLLEEKVKHLSDSLKTYSRHQTLQQDNEVLRAELMNVQSDRDSTKQQLNANEKVCEQLRQTIQTQGRAIEELTEQAKAFESQLPVSPITPSAGVGVGVEDPTTVVDSATVRALINQRENLKQRVHAAESKYSDCSKLCDSLKIDVGELKADNSQLLAKVLSLQSQLQHGGGSEQQNNIVTVPNNTKNIGERGGVLGVYLRLMWVSRRGRSFLVGYFVLIHVVMFVSLWARLHSKSR